MTDHISDLRWDRLLAGELSNEQRAEMIAHADTCERCMARRREIEAFAQEALPSLRLAPRRSKWWLGAPIAALAAAAIVVLVIRVPRTEENERSKGGGIALLLSAGRPDALVPIASNDTLHAGDYVQAGYTSARDGFGAVISLDGAGTSSIYVPATGDAMVALPAGTNRSYPSSTVLDDVLGSERIAVIWCASSQPLAPMIAELRSTQRIADREGCTIRLVVVTKQ